MDSHITRPASGATVATVRGQFTTVYSLEPRAPIKPDPLDDISGPTAIAAHIGLTAERTLDLLERGLLPTRRVGGEWVCRRSRLAEIFGEVPANG